MYDKSIQIKYFIFENLQLMSVDTCNGVEKFFFVFSALNNVKLCETCFLSKKSCRKKVFQKFLPYRGIRNF